MSVTVKWATKHFMADAHTLRVVQSKVGLIELDIAIGQGAVL
jgi:hypothetical protein